MSGNPWDALAPLYAGNGRADEPPVEVADNVLLAWPPVVDLLIREMGTLGGKRVLNYGCGTGQFCRKIMALGAKTVGVDTSPAMIDAARHLVPAEADLRVGGMDTITPHERFDAITCLMVLPYIQDPAPILKEWARHLEPHGVVAIAVFNPGFARELLRSGHFFRDFDSQERPRRGILDLTGHDPLPVYIRYAEEYAYLFEIHGFHLVFEARPPFTAEFLIQYPRDYPTKTPEYLIMGFRHQPA